MSAAQVSTHAIPLRRAIMWLLVLAVAGLALFGAGWLYLSRWQPDRDRWPVQGVAVSGESGALLWPALAATGAQFAYIDAITGGMRGNPAFTREHDAALEAGLRVGAVHHYALCRTASEQAAAFVTLVPREAHGLPAAVIITDDPECRNRPSRALLLSELTTFFNQVETHLGKPVILATDEGVESEYRVTEAINRPLWVHRNWREPDVTGERPWVIWEANDMLSSEGAAGPVQRLVLNGAGI